MPLPHPAPGAGTPTGPRSSARTRCTKCILQRIPRELVAGCAPLTRRSGRPHPAGDPLSYHRAGRRRDRTGGTDRLQPAPRPAPARAVGRDDRRPVDRILLQDLRRRVCRGPAGPEPGHIAGVAVARRRSHSRSASSGSMRPPRLPGGVRGGAFGGWGAGDTAARRVVFGAPSSSREWRRARSGWRGAAQLPVTGRMEAAATAVERDEQTIRACDGRSRAPFRLGQDECKRRRTLTPPAAS
jgi:hypothetical protein